MQSYQLRNFREDNKETWRSFGSLDELEQVGLSGFDCDEIGIQGYKMTRIRDLRFENISHLDVIKSSYFFITKYTIAGVYRNLSLNNAIFFRE